MGRKAGISWREVARSPTYTSVILPKERIPARNDRQCLRECTLWLETMRSSSFNGLNKNLWVGSVLRIRLDRPFISSCLFGLGCLLLPVALSASEASEVRNLAARADALMLLGVAEMGESRAFDQATALLGQAEDQLARAEQLSRSARSSLWWRSEPALISWHLWSVCRC